MKTFDFNLPRQLIRECRSANQRTKVADSSGASLSGSNLLLRTLVLRRMLNRDFLTPEEKTVGVLLPPSVAATVVNFALAFDRRVSVNLNYTVSDKVLNQCLDVAEIEHVLTSRKFMERLNLKLDKKVVYLEDLKDQPTLMDKASSFFWSKIASVRMLENHIGVEKIKKDDPLTIIFTSGSTGTPKGVVLSYENIASNVNGIADAIGLDENDVVLGVLPFFHSFGYTVTLWAATALPPMGVYHFNPLDSRQIGKLAEQYKATVLLGTPTFLRTYIRRIEPKQFENLDVVVVGAEKMPLGLANAFQEKFGVRPIEGYGSTELSPVVAVNLPPSRSKATDETKGLCEGSVGRCLPGVEARVVSPDDGRLLPTDEPGMLQVRGPNVMTGYLKRDDLTAEVMKDGWYETGDIARLDEKGFIHITGRLSRFSKIGGEMVPHIQIEEMINDILSGGPTESDVVSAVVTAVPDEKRGERIVVLHTEIAKQPDEIIRELSANGLPNLFLPTSDSFLKVEKIPLLGTGKLDLNGMRETALEHFSS
jgi:acyl-[acyl-carrier-protein]-phospholipid O-acyltransferase/long-chain-fatty-acid--[acyl-carrier-protein] ligase